MQIRLPPDTDVRAAPVAAPRTGRPPPFRVLARSLLSSRVARAALLAGVTTMSACVVPVGPNFQDPPATPDGAPNLFNFAPATFGAVVSVPATGITFSASVTDPDVGDTLYYRWVLDYPPFSAATRLGNQSTIAPRADHQPINQSLSQPVDCVFANPVSAPADGKHQLELIVADRAWSTDIADLSADRVLDTLDDPAGLIARAGWTVVISCPVQ